MSDIPDRSGLLDRGTGFGPPFCSYPAPHSDFIGLGQQTASSSASSEEDCLNLFDWDAYETTDATTQSDVLSAATPSPAGPGTSHRDDYPMPDAPSPERQLVWPQVPGPHPPRDTNILLEASPSPPPSTEMHLDAHSHSPLPPSEKKTRVVKDPEETSQVRGLKACYRCKMNKRACNADEFCGPCQERGFSKSECIRKPLKDMPPSTFARWNFWGDPNFLMPGREQFVEGPPHELFISCSDSTDSPCLKLVARPFAPPNQTDPGAQRRWGISPSDERPSPDKINDWMEQQIWAETETDFESEMDKLLLQFVHRSQAGTQWEEQQQLLSDILKMRCMWKLWSSKRLFVRQQPGFVAFPFDLKLVSIQDSLRLFAAQAISELERKILPVIDKCFIRQDAKKDTKKDPPVMKWLLLWQVILIYRQSLGCVLGQQQTDSAPIPIQVMPMSGRHIFRETTRRLFEAIIVTYSEMFKTKAVIKRIRDAELSVFGGDCDLHKTYQRVWQTLPDFFQQVRRQVSPTDELFIKCIVESDIPAKARAAHK